MKQDGLGSLYEEYEKLKKQLSNEGLFDESHKKKIPFMPKEIGVLTASTGAVIKDIINVSTRRNPGIHIKLYPVPVQGVGAAEKIVNGIKFMNDHNLADVLIIGRGGGSLEDLWPFNEESVARAIYDSKIPIISAVGHETDFTIADFVADLRAPTPSAAAELAVADIEEVKNNIKGYYNRYQQALRKKLDLMKLQYEKQMTRKAFTNLLQKINDNYLIIDIKVKELITAINNSLKEEKTKYVKEISKLDALSPLKTLARGYGIISKNNQIITSVEQIKTNDLVDIKLNDGSKSAKVL